MAFGAVLGKVSPIQLLIMTFFQVTLFAVNEFILLNLLKVSRAQNGDEVGGDAFGGQGMEKYTAGETCQPGESLNLLNVTQFSHL